MIVMKVFGVQDVLDAFADLPRTVRNKHMRIGLNAAAGVIRDMAVTFAPKESGLLRKSLKVKVRIPEASHNAAHHSKPAYAVVGPGRNMGRILKRKNLRGFGEGQRDLKAERVRLKADGTIAPLNREREAVRFVKASFKGVIYRNPSRYAHLVEGGTKPHMAGKRKHPGSRAQHFLQRAVSFAGPVAQAKMIGKLKDGIQNWAASRRVSSRVAIGA